MPPIQPSPHDVPVAARPPRPIAVVSGYLSGRPSRILGVTARLDAPLAVALPAGRRDIFPVGFRLNSSTWPMASPRRTTADWPPGAAHVRFVVSPGRQASSILKYCGQASRQQPQTHALALT